MIFTIILPTTCKTRLLRKDLLGRLEKAILSLDEMPERYRAYEKEPWHSRGLWVVPVERYIVYYTPDAESRIVRIVRVIYGGRDTEAQLKQTN